MMNYTVTRKYAVRLVGVTLPSPSHLIDQVRDDDGLGGNEDNRDADNIVYSYMLVTCPTPLHNE